MQKLNGQSGDGNKLDENACLQLLYKIAALKIPHPEEELDQFIQLATLALGMELGVLSKAVNGQFEVFSVFQSSDTFTQNDVHHLQKASNEHTLRQDDIFLTHDADLILEVGHQNVKTCIGIPLTSQEHITGILSFYSTSDLDGAFSNQEILLLKTLGGWISKILVTSEKILALEESEHQYKTLVESGLALLCIHDMEGNILQVNQSAKNELGYRTEELLQINLRDLIIPSFRNAFDAYLQRIKKNKRDEGILAIRTKGGEVLYWSYKNKLENEKVIGFSQDVTDKIRTQSALVESQRNLKEAQALVKLGSWSYQIVEQKMVWSDEIYQIYERDTTQGAPSFNDYMDYIHPEDLPIVQRLIETSFIKEEPYKLDYRICLPGDVIKYVHGTGRPITDEAGDVIRLLGTIQDVTDRVMVNQELIRTKEKAEAAAKVKQEFLANMSHEIRTPMNAILGFARLSLQTELNEEQKEYIGAIYESAEALLVVINDILDFSKIEAGKLPIVHSHFDLVRLMDNLKKLFSLKVNQSNLRVLFEIDPAIPPALFGDPVRLNQILNNLISNAIKFTDKGFVETRVQLISHQNGDYMIRFTVRDTGIGISQEKLESVFNSFEQGEGYITRKYGGTGLGLAIVKKLTDLMEGSIEVESTPDLGSVFTVTLPYQIGIPEKIKTEGIEQGFSSSMEILQGKHILLAEDNRNNQVLAKKVLNDVGCQVDIAANGRLAVEMLLQHDYDLVLMDIQMPEMDGLQATVNIRSLESMKAAIPIIAMTAHALQEEQQQYKQIGMNDYITKPFKPEILYAKLLKVYGESVSVTQEPEATISQTTLPHSIEQIDLAGLQEFAGGDTDFIQEMLSIFVQDVPGYLEEIENSLKHQNWLPLKKAAHALKSSIGFLNMPQTLEVLSSIEDLDMEATSLAKVSNICEYIITNCYHALEVVKKAQ